MWCWFVCNEIAAKKKKSEVIGKSKTMVQKKKDKEILQ